MQTIKHLYFYPGIQRHHTPPIFRTDVACTQYFQFGFSLRHQQWCPAYISCIVMHSKCCPPVGRGHVDLSLPLGGGAERLVKLHGQGCIGGLRESTLLVQDGKETHVLLQEHVQDGLVAGEADGVECHALLGALFLFPLEDVLVEVLLELLICHVDAHLRGRGGGEISGKDGQLNNHSFNCTCSKLFLSKLSKPKISNSPILSG